MHRHLRLDGIGLLVRLLGSLQGDMRENMLRELQRRLHQRLQGMHERLRERMFGMRQHMHQQLQGHVRQRVQRVRLVLHQLRRKLLWRVFGLLWMRRGLLVCLRLQLHRRLQRLLGMLRLLGQLRLQLHVVVLVHVLVWLRHGLLWLLGLLEDVRRVVLGNLRERMPGMRQHMRDGLHGMHGLLGLLVVLLGVRGAVRGLLGVLDGLRFRLRGWMLGAVPRPVLGRLRHHLHHPMLRNLSGNGHVGHGVEGITEINGEGENMEKTIQIDQETCDRLERLHYEYNALANVETAYLDAHRLDPDGSALASEAYREYHAQTVAAFAAYERAKAELAREHGLSNVNWQLDFATGEVHVS